MTNPNLCEVIVLLDRSGSMASVEREMRNGFNHFVEQQRALPGECRLTLIQFDGTPTGPEIECVHQSHPVALVPPLEFQPRGSTPLLDAVGRTIISTGKLLAELPEEQRPGKVVFLIITDGQENSSRDFTRERVRFLIERQTTVYKWEFLYLGAGVDAFAEAASIGIAQSHAARYAAGPRGARAMLNVASAKIGAHRASGQSVAFSQAERDRLSAGDEEELDS